MSVEATIVYGARPLITQPPRISRGRKGVLDAATLEVLCDHDQVDEQLEDLGYEPGKRVWGYHSMWVDALEEEDESDLTKLCQVQLLGLVKDEDKRRRVISAFGRVVAVGPIERVILVTNQDESATDPEDDSAATAVRRIPKVDDDGEVVYIDIATPSGFGERWNINEPVVTVSDRYFTTTEPLTSQIGTALAPVSAPTPPAFQWAGYADGPVRANHPNGWVLDNRESVELFRDGVFGLWEVSDNFGYYQEYQPD